VFVYFHDKSPKLVGGFFVCLRRLGCEDGSVKNWGEKM